MVKICSKCKKPSIIFLRYNGTYLCADHFIDYFKRRVKRNIKKQGRTKNNSTLGVAVSGGKDSVVTLHLIQDIFSQRANVDICAITVDEGIKGYRDESIKIARNNCRTLGINHYHVSFKDTISRTLDEIASRRNKLGACTYCGVFRRSCLNKKAKELNIDKLVTGHNLDDMAQSIMMNFANCHLQKLVRLGPHKKIQPGLVPRMIPLRTIPEKEVLLYAIINNVEFYDGICPYSVDASRGLFRDIVDELEYKNPGTRHSILNSYDTIRDLLLDKFPPAKLYTCKLCGEPTSNSICKTCHLKNEI